MPIDITNEDLVRLADVPKLKFMPLNKGGKRIHIATLYRWALGGTGGTRLETLKVGGSLCTSVEALQRFFDALSKGDGVGPRQTHHGAALHGTTAKDANDPEFRLDRLIYGPSGKPGPMDAEMAKRMKDPALRHMSPRQRRRHLHAERELRKAGF